MMSFRGTRLAGLRLPLNIVWLLESLAESKGKEASFRSQSPQFLETLREMALVESAESSNRIEGVTVERDRLRPLVLEDAKPRDRSEEEIAGYRKALNWLHTDHGKIEITPETILRLHALAQGGTTGDAGQWKEKPNDIIEILPNGSRRVRFKPVSPEETPGAVEELCIAYKDAVDQGEVTPLLSTAALVFDFLCIHPFRDGNGRVSRLLTLLALYHHGYGVGCYVSHERIVEERKEDYYEVLRKSSAGWHEGEHDIFPWFTYLLGALRTAYREFDNRAKRERPVRGNKTELIEYALEQMTAPFGIADIERLCPNISREMIRRVMNRWRKDGRLEMLSRGRDAKWRRVEKK